MSHNRGALAKDLPARCFPFHCSSVVRGQTRTSIVRIRESRGVQYPHLYRGGVEHDADHGTEGLGGEVVLELCADNAGVACGDLSAMLLICLPLMRPLIPDLSPPFPSSRVCGVRKRTVRAGDLAPDDTDLGAADLLLATVDVGNALAVVEGGGLGVVDALDLDERGVGPDRVLRALERDVLAPVGTAC